MARAMFEGVGYGLSFPPKHTRMRLIDMPEICLIAAIVVAAKHFLPFPTRKENSLVLRGAVLVQMDWQKWSELMQPAINKLQEKSLTDVSGDIDGGHLANADEATFDAILALLSSDQGGDENEGGWTYVHFRRHAS